MGQDQEQDAQQVDQERVERDEHTAFSQDAFPEKLQGNGQAHEDQVGARRSLYENPPPGGGEPFSRDRVEEEAEKEVLGKIPVDQREWFGSLLKSAQNWNWWNEEHEFWLNDAVYTLMRRVMLEYGKRFVKAGTFDQVDDIFHLREIFRRFHGERMPLASYKVYCVSNIGVVVHIGYFGDVPHPSHNQKPFCRMSRIQMVFGVRCSEIYTR